jgi:hypothetical protein
VSPRSATHRHALAVLGGAVLASGRAFASDGESPGVVSPDAASLPNDASHGDDPDGGNYAHVWARADADRVGLQLWTGATPALGSLDLAIDLVISQAYPGAVDPTQSSAYNLALDDEYRAPSIRLGLGPAFSWGSLFVSPKLGIGYDFERQRLAPLVPQAFVIVQAGPAYFESWQQIFLYDLFEAGAQDSYYTRNLLLVALGEPTSVGLELDATVAIQNSAGDALRSLPFGVAGNVQVARELTFGLFLGYESQPEARNTRGDFVAGRVTATALWR